MYGSCARCEYMQPSYRSKGKAECHRQPPQLITTAQPGIVGQGMQVQIHSVWPIVDPNHDGCGEAHGSREAEDQQ